MRKKHKVNKSKNRIQSFRVLAGNLIVLSVLVAIAVPIVGKYINISEPQTAEISAENFYFTTDLTGDSKMVSEQEQSSNYRYENIQSGLWYLYGGGSHEIVIELRNYYDSMRITKSDIEYTVNVAVESDKASANLAYLTNENGAPIAGGTLAYDEGTVGGMANQKVVLNIKALGGDISYEDETVVTVTIESTKPYVKTIQLKFKLFTWDELLLYEVKDDVNSLFAELIIMAGDFASDSDIQPYIQWSEDLQIDNTNALTYNYKNGVFTQQDGMMERNMQVSHSFNASQSESLYFFKTDIQKNYSTGGIAYPVDLVNGKYVIKILGKEGE